MIRVGVVNSSASGAFRKFITKSPLSTFAFYGVTRALVVQKCQELARFDESAAQLVEDIFKVHEVREIDLGWNGVMVRLEDARFWSYAEPQVLACIEHRLGPPRPSV